MTNSMNITVRDITVRDISINPNLSVRDNIMVRGGGSPLRRASSHKELTSPSYTPPPRSNSSNSLGKLDSSLSLDETFHSRHEIEERRTVTFGIVTCERVGRMPEECHPQVYYKGGELEDLLDEEVQQIQKAKATRYKPSSSSRSSSLTIDLETEAMTLRGMEDLMDQTDKSRKVSYHVAQVVKESARQTKAGRLDVHALKVISRRISRPDRAKALKRGKEDAKVVGHHETLPRVSSAPAMSRNEEGAATGINAKEAMKRAISKHNMKKSGPNMDINSKMVKKSSFTSLAKTLGMSKLMTARKNATFPKVSSPAC